MKRETNAEPVIKRQRKRVILDLPHHMLERLREEGPMSRVELARRIGVGAATSGNYVEKMIAAGLLFEHRDSRSIYSGKGRPPTLVDLNADGGSLVGVDVEGPVLRAVRFDFRMEAKSEYMVALPEDPGPDRFGRELLRAVDRVRPPKDANWLGIGVAFPGHVDPVRGIAEDTPLFPELRDFDIVACLARRFDVPVWVDNDMCCIAYGERLAGAGRGQDYFAGLASRAGWTGTAIFTGGELTSGPQRGLSIGDWLLPAGHPDLPEALRPVKRQGGHRCSLNELCSEAGFLAIHEKLAGGEAAKDFDEFAERVADGDATAEKALDAPAEALGRVVARIDDILRFDRIVFDGVFMKLGQLFLDRVARSFREFSMSETPEAGDKFVFSDLGERAASIGAAGLVLRHWKPAG